MKYSPESKCIFVTMKRWAKMIQTIPMDCLVLAPSLDKGPFWVVLRFLDHLGPRKGQRPMEALQAWISIPILQVQFRLLFGNSKNWKVPVFNSFPYRPITCMIKLRFKCGLPPVLDMPTRYLWNINIWVRFGQQARDRNSWHLLQYVWSVVVCWIESEEC